MSANQIDREVMGKRQVIYIHLLFISDKGKFSLINKKLRVLSKKTALIIPARKISLVKI